MKGPRRSPGSSARARLTVVVAIGLAVLASGASTASATMTGPCEASGVFVPPGGGTPVAVDARQSSARVPRAADVEWEGRLTQSPADIPRATTGAIFVRTPFDDFFDFISVNTDIETWGEDDARTTTERGVDSYDISSWVPGGAEVKVRGFHSEPGISCVGWITLSIDGSPWGSPTTWLSGALALLATAGVLSAGRGVGPGRRDLAMVGTTSFGIVAGLLLGLATLGSEWALLVAGLIGALALAAAIGSRRAGLALAAGRPNLGWLLGLVAGLFLAIFGWALGWFALDSSWLVAIPLLFTAAGFGLGIWAPLRAGQAEAPGDLTPPADAGVPS